MSPPLETLTPDLAIIGAGAAGLSIAAGASQMGARVVLVEKGLMGGECLNQGCVPSKSILAAARHAALARDGARFGVRVAEVTVDYPAVKARMRQVIAAIAPVDSADRYAGLGVTVLAGTARFLDPWRLQVTAQEAGRAGWILKPRRIVLATGSAERPLSLPGQAEIEPGRILGVEQYFHYLDRQPAHLLVLGGGPIGTELAFAEARLGTRVTMLLRDPLLPREDPELVRILQPQLEAAGITLIENRAALRLEPAPLGLRLWHGPREGAGETAMLEASHLLVAIGRVPNSAGLGLEQAGIAVDAQGQIQVDERLRTSRAHVYAVGDAAGAPYFTHRAGHHAGVILRQALLRLPARPLLAERMPRVTFTDPELASVGESEAEAVRRLGSDKVRILRFPVTENDRAIAEGHPPGLVKLIADHRDRLLGVTILAPEAGEMLPLYQILISRRLRLSQLAGMVVAYPTLAEIGKRAAGSLYTPRIFSPLMRRVVRALAWLPW